MNIYKSNDNLKRIDELIKARKYVPGYSLDDIIMFLLYADAKPIMGKTRQMKEIFLTIKEIFKNNVEPVEFKKYQFGPYSEEVEYIVHNLIFSNYLSTTGENKQPNDYTISLTNKGREYISNKFYSLPPETQNKLIEKRKQWDTHISKGVLNIVYTHYDDYLENALLKKRYSKLDWENESQTSDNT